MHWWRKNKPEIVFSHTALPVRMKRIQLKIMLHLGNSQRRAYDISLYEQFRCKNGKMTGADSVYSPHARFSSALESCSQSLDWIVYSRYPRHSAMPCSLLLPSWTLVRSDSKTNHSCNDSAEPIRKAFVNHLSVHTQTIMVTTVTPKHHNYNNNYH